MTKILFLALWYCSIYPGLYFFCSLILLVNSVTDKFSLMVSLSLLTVDVSMNYIFLTVLFLMTAEKLETLIQNG